VETVHSTDTKSEIQHNEGSRVPVPSWPFAREWPIHASTDGIRSMRPAPKLATLLAGEDLSVHADRTNGSV
jgi:hypothetical protein